MDTISDWSKNEVYKVATAESLTAGLLFSTLVDIPIGGSYKYGCFGVYDTDAKRTFLGVKVDDVYTHMCAKQMAEGVLKNSNATIAIAVTGNAMPYQKVGQLDEAGKIGEVFIGVACYKDDYTIVSKTSVYNFCNRQSPARSICKLWFNTIREKSKLNTLSASHACQGAPKQFINGMNDPIVTSFLSNYVRNKTAEVAYTFALSYLKDQRKYNQLVVPSWINESRIKPGDIPFHACNNALLVSHRKDYPKKIKSFCVNRNCTNDDRNGKGNKAMYDD